MPSPHHYLLLSPRQTCVRGNLPFLFEKKKEEKIEIWCLLARYCLPGVALHKVSDNACKYRVKSMKLTRCAEHINLYLCTGSAPGFVQRITCYIGKTCTKGGCRNRFWQPRLTGKTYEDARCSSSCSPECHLRSQGG